MQDSVNHDLKVEAFSPKRSGVVDNILGSISGKHVKNEVSFNSEV